MSMVFLFFVITPMLSAAFAYLFKILDTVDYIRREIIQLEIWNDEQYPKGVADIEGAYDHSILVCAYYTMTHNSHRQIMTYACGALSMLFLALIAVAFGDELSGLLVSESVSLITLAQIAVVVIASAY